MGWISRLLLLSLLGLAASQSRSIGSDSRRRNRVVAGKSEVIDFNCPEDFGYYPHPSDCTQYYVCVFGGALQESCTGGLMYSHELQTCDWPRNVICTLSTGGVSTVRITDPRTSASTPIRPATEALTPSVGSFSGSRFTSQDSQATDLFPVRFQGGSERGARGFTSSSPSQQSLARQTIQHVSRFPETKALQESSISSVVQTNNPAAFQYLVKQSRRIRDTSQLGTLFADFSNQDFDIRPPSQDFFQSGSPQQQEPRNLQPRNPTHPHFQNAGFAHREQAGPSAHTSFFELPQRTFQNTNFQNAHFGGNPFQIQRQFHQPSPSRSSSANSFGNFQSFSPPSFSSLDSSHSAFDTRPVKHTPPSHASSRSSFLQNHFPDSPSQHRFPQPPQQPGFPQSHLNANFPPQSSHKTHFPPQPSHAQGFPFNPQGKPPSKSSEPFRIDEARPITTPKPNHFTTLRSQHSKHPNTPPKFNQRPQPQFPPPPPSPHFPPKQGNFPKSQFPPPQPGFPPKSQAHFPPPSHPRFPPQSTAQFPAQTTAKFPPQPPVQFPPQTPKQFPPPPTSRFPQKQLPLQEQSRFPHKTEDSVVHSSEPHKLSPNPLRTSEKKPQHILSPISKTTPKPNTISSTKSKSSSNPETKASNPKLGISKQRFSEFTSETPTKRNPSAAVISGSKPPRIPGTARQPELSRLSAVSNPAESPSSSLPSSSSPHKRPLNSISRPLSRAPQRPKPTPAPVLPQTPRPSARPTSRSTARPSPAAISFDDSFYPGLNFTDADYYYYYDDLLYDYYDAADFTATSTPTPFRRPATTPRPISRGTPPTRRPSSSQSSSGPVTTDNSIPKRSRRPTLKPVSVIAPTTSEAIDIFKYPPKRPAPRYPQPVAETVASKCDSKVCRLPDCSCGGKAVPGGFAPENIPQLVLLTFDDAVNDLNKGLYQDLFEVGRKNPNGCPIQSTMYVSHEWTDYSQVQNLYAEGHEIASHSVSHSFGEQFSVKKWAKEVGGQREILAAYGGVKMEDVRGMRAPFLAIGGNKMFKMLYDQNFTYDSSMPVYENNPPSWPYTLDYKVFHDCMIPPCPTLSYPGVWQVPMVMWQDLNGGRCSMGDACTTPPDAEGVYKMLIKNFERHYTTNRAPFGLFYHAAWFTTPHHKEGFIAFLDTITAMDDVWLVTNWQALQYVRDPVSLSQVKNYKPFQCSYPDRPSRCDRPKVCNVWHKGGVRYMRTCQKCPEKYPWTGNTGVRSPLNDL